MIPEIGHFLLILALCFSLVQMILPLIGVRTESGTLMQAAVPVSLVVFTLVLASFVLLEVLFLADDFSVAYAANNSNSLLPWYYKLSAVWGAHEGSMLLWILVLSGWTLAVALTSGKLPIQVRAIVLAVQAALAVGFLLFILCTSNPFDRLLPYSPADGADLNPLLQDFGLIIHPPLLYMGYVGLSVPFSFALAALVLGQLNRDWVRWLRPWTNTAWAFLTGGIALGSWWAYYELGWGGWWFWDPVENASFMPWLLATALIHSLAVAEKRDMFKRWALLLAIFAFSLSLLGTFLVRSGVLTSVHAFATDPERGLFILLFLSCVVGFSLLLYGIRMKDVETAGAFTPLSRETGLLVNNLLLVLMCAIVLLGTLYPLLIDTLDMGSISVGPPYFNLFAGLVFIPMFVMLGAAQRLNWVKDRGARLWRYSLLPLVLAVVASIIAVWVAGRFSPLVLLGGFLGAWIFLQGQCDLWSRAGHHQHGILAGLQSLGLGYWGMQLAHFGVALCLVGVLFSVALSESRDVRMEAGDSYELAGYRFEMNNYAQVQGPNYVAEEGRVQVSRNQRTVAAMQPQKRTYLASRQTMTEAGIEGNLLRDLYVSMGEPVGEGAWAVRLHVKPFVRWIWYGALFMALGGLLAVCDRRYRHRADTAVGERT